MFTVAEVAEYLNVHPATIHRMIGRGELAAVRVHGQWRIPEVELMNFINGNSTSTPVIYFSETPVG